MAGGRSVLHTDTDPLFHGYHDGPDGVEYIQDDGVMFKQLGAVAGLYAENATTGNGGVISSVTKENKVYISPTGGEFPYTLHFVFGGGSSVTFDNGDEYKIYKTDEKGSTISYDWVDRSRGWQARPEDLQKGWRSEDVDLDDHRKHKVFGPNQPER